MIEMIGRREEEGREQRNIFRHVSEWPINVDRDTSCNGRVERIGK